MQRVIIRLTAMRNVSIVDFGSYLPEKQVNARDFFDGDDPLAHSAMLRAPETRHHVSPAQRAAEMIEAATRPMFERMGIQPPGNVDVLITNVLLPDNPITGSGAEAAHRLGCSPKVIVDLHNGGCAAFPYMLRLAQSVMQDEGMRNALLCTVQNGAGKLCALPGARKQPQSAVPGDGCGVAYLTAGEEYAQVLGIETRNTPAHALDMGLASPDGRLYWEPGTSELAITMDATRLKDILEFGNRIVPELVGELCKRLGRKSDEIDVLVTNQPNRIFLRNWHESLGIPAARHFDTFDRFGNLMSASVPVTMDHAVREGRLADGALVVIAGFAHAGDFASAAAFRWLSAACST
jgi:3-oxoacyl-[acyl-carrier-protein] synthase III